LSDILVVRDLRCAFGGVVAVDGVSFSCAEGEVTGLIGPNGAGKSTVIGAIAGKVRPTGGSICYRGEELAGQAPYRIARRGISRTYQMASVFDRMTVLENVLVGARSCFSDSLRGALLGPAAWRRWQEEAVDRARQLIARCDLLPLEDQYAGELSGGQKRLVEITRALMPEATFLLLDEPMAGVNPTLANRIADYLRDLAAGGLSILMVEHELSVVEHLCPTVVVMAEGRVILKDSMAEVRRNREVLDAYLGS